MARRRSEAGAASITVVALALILVLIAGGAGSVVALVVAHRAAQKAADLAALAGAQSLAQAADGCAAAREIAAANDAQLATCSIAGSSLTVDVIVSVTFGVRTEVHAHARAGPAMAASR